MAWILCSAEEAHSDLDMMVQVQLFKHCFQRTVILLVAALVVSSLVLVGMGTEPEPSKCYSEMIFVYDQKS